MRYMLRYSRVIPIAILRIWKLKLFSSRLKIKNVAKKFCKKFLVYKLLIKACQLELTLQQHAGDHG